MAATASSWQQWPTLDDAVATPTHAAVAIATPIGSTHDWSLPILPSVDSELLQPAEESWAPVFSAVFPAPPPPVTPTPLPPINNHTHQHHQHHHAVDMVDAAIDADAAPAAPTIIRTPVQTPVRATLATPSPSSSIAPSVVPISPLPLPPPPPPPSPSPYLASPSIIPPPPLPAPTIVAATNIRVITPQQHQESIAKLLAPLPITQSALALLPPAVAKATTIAGVVTATPVTVAATPATPATPAATAAAAQTRRYTACDACHRLKTKCDGQRPCGRCHRMRRPDQCLDRAPPPLGRKRRPKAGSAAEKAAQEAEKAATAATAAVAAAAVKTEAQHQHQHAHSHDHSNKKHARSPSAGNSPTHASSPSSSSTSLVVPGKEQNAFDVTDAAELMAFRDWQRKRQRRNMDEWQAALAGVDTSLYDQPPSMHASVPNLPLRQYDETRVVRTAMYGLVPWLRHLLVQEVGVPVPGPECLPEILRQLDRPLCPACVHPGKLCPVCDGISFRKAGSFDWGLWVQSALMYITWLPREVVVYPAPHLDAMPMAALVLQVDDECFGTTVMFPESLRSAECPGSARLLALISEREAANAAEAAAAAALAGTVSPSPSPSLSSSSSSTSPSPYSPKTPPTDVPIGSGSQSPSSSSSSFGSSPRDASISVTAGSVGADGLHPAKTEFQYSEQAADSQDYCLVPVRDIPIPPMARPNRYRCSINKTMERLLGFTPEDMRRRASVRGWQLLWRMVSPRETQQFLMNHWRSIAGLVSEWSMSLHLATKSNTVVRVMLWAKYTMVEDDWSSTTYFMAPLPPISGGVSDAAFSF